MDSIIAEITASRYCTTNSIFQYDTGRKLELHGCKLSKNVEVQFSTNKEKGDAQTRIGTTVNGITTVLIPNNLLNDSAKTMNYNIYAFAYHVDDESGRTEYVVTIPVIARPKPENPSEEPLPEPNIFHETVSAVNDAADRAEQAVSDVENIRDNLNLDLSKKITRPDKAEVGQVLAVKEIDESGKPTVFEAEDVKVPTKTSELENDSGFLTEHQDISGKLDKEKLPEAIDDALAQSKESGAFDGRDGKNGADGKDGEPGKQGPKGDPGETTYVENPYDDTGIKADVDDIKQALEDTVEVETENKTPLWTPNAAEVGQILRIQSINDDGSVILEAVAGGINDVQIKGESIVEDGIAKIPIATANTNAGVVTIDQYATTGGLQRANEITGLIRVFPARRMEIDARSSPCLPISASTLDYAVKRAMCDGKGEAWTADEQANARERMGAWLTITDITLEEDVSMLEPIEVHGYRKYEIIVVLPSVITMDCFIQPSIHSATNAKTAMAYESAKNTQFLLFEIEEFFYHGGVNYATFVGCESYKGGLGAITPGSKKYSSVMFNYNSKEVFPYITGIGLNVNGNVLPEGTRIVMRGCN